jgi:hypothetical protein
MATRKSSTGFETPSNGDPGDLPENTGGESSSEFEVPAGEDVMSADAADAQIESFMAGVDSQLLAAKAQLEQMLGSFAGDSLAAQTQEMMDSNLAGVAIGLGDGTSLAPGRAPGDPVLEVYTIEPDSPAEMRARLAAVAGVSALADAEFPMKVVHTGLIDAQPHRMRLRPAPGGISVGHKAITAGTLGCLVRGRSAPRLNRLMILSNNHVLANSNAAVLGDAILQPGPYDGGTHPADQVAVLERFRTISFAAGASNLVDCATGWAWPERVRRELMYLSGGSPHYFRIGATPVAATLGLAVGKSGRTTQLTRGSVVAVGATINVNYGGGRVARFVNQISIRAPSGDFSQGGDSGSLIWTWDTRRAPVGLLFAGGGGTTFANRISDVLKALDVQIVS